MKGETLCLASILLEGLAIFVLVLWGGWYKRQAQKAVFSKMLAHLDLARSLNDQRLSALTTPELEKELTQRGLLRQTGSLRFTPPTDTGSDGQDGPGSH